jgi:hypothetical protein
MVPVTTKQIKILLTRLLVSVVLYWIGLFKDSGSGEEIRRAKVLQYIGRVLYLTTVFPESATTAYGAVEPILPFKAAAGFQVEIEPMMCRYCIHSSSK